MALPDPRFFDPFEELRRRGIDRRDIERMQQQMYAPPMIPAQLYRYGEEMPTGQVTGVLSTNKMPKKFNENDKVVLLDAGGYGYSDSNPVWGKDGLYISGVVAAASSTEVIIRWDNGNRNQYTISQCKIELLAKIKPVKVGKAKLDLKQMEPLIIDPIVKAEIISVIKQHENYVKLFEDWGLGEVIEYGKGMTMLFWGPPGTGKTWAAHCIAKTLGQELLSIGMAEIQTSEPGGANRNIQNAFKAATEQGKVLFIDECDSLVTSRKQVGMIIGGEINTLLQEIEKYEGVVVLATNRIEELDEALERRISYIAEFPEPDFDARKLIWERMLPKKLPLAKDVNATSLAEFKLTGGLIKNVLLSAARAAISSEQKYVTLENFRSAIDNTQKSGGKMGKRARQYEKMGDKVLSESVDTRKG